MSAGSAAAGAIELLLLTFASGVKRVAAINVGAAARASESTAARRVMRILSSSVDHHGSTTPASACGESTRHPAARRHDAGNRRTRMRHGPLSRPLRFALFGYAPF